MGVLSAYDVAHFNEIFFPFFDLSNLFIFTYKTNRLIFSICNNLY